LHRQTDHACVRDPPATSFLPTRHTPHTTRHRGHIRVR
jgi:hypothetical protein